MYCNWEVYPTCTYILQDKKTALHHCAAYGHASVVQRLIRAGADVNAVDRVSLMYNELKVLMLK